MANKSVLIGGRTINVKGRSSFDKSFLNALTTGVGTITPIFKKLVIPSSGRITVPVHVELPPLATDAYLRSHLKLEAFYTPARLLTGSFQSWFSGEEVYDAATGQFGRAELPCAFVPSYLVKDGDQTTTIGIVDSEINFCFGPSSLTDYFNVKFKISSGDTVVPFFDELPAFSDGVDDYTARGCRLNLLPYLNYHLLFHHFYRNKSVQRPVFAPTPDSVPASATSILHAYNIPFVCSLSKRDVLLGSSMETDTEGSDPLSSFIDVPASCINDILLDGTSLFSLRQRNFGDDYFTAARPQAQSGSPVTVQVDADGKFSIASLRMQNALQEFAEVQGYATPDYVQTNLARYGVSVANAVCQKPVILGSADFPIFTKSVELNSNLDSGAALGSGNTRNPFANDGILGAKAGSASGNGTFSFDFDVKEVGYIMVMATLVPEANYATGIDHDMRIFVGSGDLTDLPCSLLEHVGDEPIMSSELYSSSAATTVFGYVQRYLWHKAGAGNQIHGLYRKGESLEAFIPQREFTSTPQISSAFLRVPTTALDDVASVSSGISNYGVQLDCAFNVHISEPLSESALPSLSDPAREHGREVYLSNGGSNL